MIKLSFKNTFGKGTTFKYLSLEVTSTNFEQRSAFKIGVAGDFFRSSIGITAYMPKEHGCFESGGPR
jgi:hypothetical protein